MKKFGFFILLLLLCGFSKEDYKVETLKSQDGIEFKFYIPKNYCRYNEIPAANKIMAKLIGINSIDEHTSLYNYRDCEEDKLFKSGKTIEITGGLLISIPKKSILMQKRTKDLNNILAKNLKAMDPIVFNIIRGNLSKLNLKEELKNEKLTKNEYKYIENMVKDLKTFYYSENPAKYNTINNNLITTFFVEDQGNKYNMNRFSGTINGIMIDLTFTGENNKNILENNKEFGKYIEATKALNKLPDNYYIEKNNEIINIKLPNYGEYLDVTNIFGEALSDMYDRVIVELTKEKDPNQIFMGIMVEPANKTLFKNGIGTQKTKNNKPQGFVRLPINVLGKEIIYYCYLVDLKGQDTVICSTLLSKVGKLDDRDEEKIKKVTDKYIKYLKKINR